VLEIGLKGLRTLRRTGIAVSAGDIAGLGALTSEIGSVIATGGIRPQPGEPGRSDNRQSSVHASGNLIPSRSQPREAGYSVANGYQGPRSLQAQIRSSF
jgi:hypothetical protein